jgi:hypothetical protein
MSEPAQVGEVLPGVLAEVVERAGRAMTGGPSWSLRRATAITQSAWSGGSSRPTR